MPRKYLMLELKDNRKFFTEQRNLNQLIEFSKVFGAEISVVKANDAIEVLDLISLAENVCTESHKIHDPNLQVLEVKVPRKKRSRKTSRTIESWIKNKLLSGETICIADISKKYKNLKLTTSCFCQHLGRVRQEFGDKIEKVAKGQYKLKLRVN
jgi:hypothetical protein